jgi:SPP1 gp7 family putative phage head morphogenesis protein
MARQFGVDQARTDQRADVFAETVDRSLTRVANATARGLSAVPSELDLAGVRSTWARQVETVLLPIIEREWRRAADEMWVSVSESLERQTEVSVIVAAADVAQTPTRTAVNTGTVAVPKVPIQAARTYLQTAQNRLVGVGDLLWSNMREELVSGLTAGEGTADVARRLKKTAEMTSARANVIARTEVIGATNRGAYSQMLATGLIGTKTWLATNDKRTRPAHAAASGKTRDITGTFFVGGRMMDGPHDPNALPEQTINCRCTLLYDVDPPEDETPSITIVEKSFDDKLVESLREYRADDGVSIRMSDIVDAEQRKSFDRYTGTAYERINGGLRRGGELSENVTEHIKNMDAVFAEAETSDSIVSYRGVLGSNLMFGDAWGEFDLAGLEWVDNGFSSTTAIERIAVGFTSNAPNNAALFRIITPPNSKMIYLGDQEHELLLNRGTKFRVVRDNGKNGAGTRMLDVEVLST